jgi:hypothetical protein
LRMKRGFNLSLSYARPVGRRARVPHAWMVVAETGFEPVTNGL